MRTLTFVLVGSVLLASTPSAASIEKVVELSRLCDAGRRLFCRELAIIAREERDWQIRAAAVRLLSDGALLAHLARHAPHPYVRGAAARRLDDSAVLTQVVLRDDDEDVRLAALWRISDDALLTRIARSESRLERPKETESYEVRQDGVQRISDASTLFDLARDASFPLHLDAVWSLDAPEMLGDIAKGHDRSFARERAPEKLAEECSKGEDGACRELEVVAMDGEDPEVRRAAAETLRLRAVSKLSASEPEALIDYALGDPADSVRRAAVSKLTDEAILARIARRDPSPEVRVAALDRMTDQEVFAEIAVSDTDAETRAMAVLQLTDESLLKDFALHADSAAVRTAACVHLRDQAVLEIAARDPDAMVRSTAAQKLSDPARLGEVALSDPDMLTRLLAVLNPNLISPSVLLEVAATDSDGDVKAAAIAKLTAPPLLADLARHSKERIVRYAAVTHPGLVDRRTLTAVAAKDPEPLIRAEAIVRLAALSGETALRFLARYDVSDLVRQLATVALSDQVLLSRIATTDDHAGVRIKAVRNLLDEDQLRRISRGDDDYFVRSAAQSQLSWLAHKRGESGR